MFGGKNSIHSNITSLLKEIEEHKVDIRMLLMLILNHKQKWEEEVNDLGHSKQRCLFILCLICQTETYFLIFKVETPNNRNKFLVSTLDTGRTQNNCF